MPRYARGVLLALAAICCLGLLAAKPQEARANIPWPYQFMPHIDGYAGNQGQSTCHTAPMPGVADFSNLLNFWFGSRRSEIMRDCNRPGRSEHKEGRALDYHVHYYRETAATWKVLDWVLRSDEHGNRHAFGRRFGLMYIISDGLIFRYYRAHEGWQPYTPSGESTCRRNDPRQTACHVDHIHFSFGWPGALRQTSWWTTTQQTRRGCGSTVETWTYNTGYGPLTHVKKIQDYYGKTFDTQSEIRNSYWRVRAGGQMHLANQPLSVFANPRPQALLPVVAGGAGGWCPVNLY